MAVAATDTGYARELEAEALDYPEERGQILLEAAAAWIRAGEPQRGTQLLQELIDTGGEDGCYARVELAEALLNDGQVAAAHDCLAGLARDPALHDGHCEMAAALLAERGDLAEALRWYDRLVARLRPEQIEVLRRRDGWAQLTAIPLRGRREVRRKLGLPADAMDEIVPVAPLEQPQLEQPDPHGFRALRGAGGRSCRELRVLTFQRAERAEARRRWPGEFPESDAEYYPAAERRWAELADGGAPTIRVVPATVAGLVAFAERSGGAVTDPELGSRYANAVPEQQLIAWPPPRNAQCWCGSGGKYKRCCGRPR